MKNRNIFLVVLILVCFALPVYADSLESVRVIKFWDATDDLIVERASGERLLIQHNRACSTMSTEFPVQLVWEGDDLKAVKVSYNEQCEVYNYGPYTGDLTITGRVASPNALDPEHLATVQWEGANYQIDYGEGCENIKDYIGKIAYVNAPEGNLNGAMLYLPKARGQCGIREATSQGQVVQADSPMESPIKNLKYKAENNQVLFSWDKFPADETWLALVAYSKYRLNPDELSMSQMPNLRRSRFGTLRLTRLMNNQEYYFYITAMNGEGKLAPWTEIPITPVQTNRRFINHPDPEAFEIEMTEDAAGYSLSWPDKSEHTSRYMIQLYVNGRRELWKFLDADTHYFVLDKKPEWKGVGFRLVVRSIPLKPYGLRYFDSIFWQAK